MVVTDDIAFIIDSLKHGGVAVIPTDTVYGVVASAHDKDAVARLYALKHRDHKPGTVVAADVQQLIEIGLKPRYLRAVEHLWPNSLSVEIPLGPELAYLHQDTGRQGFRVVKDKNLLKILRHTGPLLTSSANNPGVPGANTVQEAENYFGDRVDFYVDGGDLSGHAPSTLVRIIDDAIEVIRMGAVKITESGRIEE
jgi:L-threonylcarbamoyladenylate synthase